MLRKLINRTFCGRTVLKLAGVVALSLPLLGQAPPGADTFVSASTPRVNYGPSFALVVQPGATSYIQFNLSGIPAGASVSKATLRLYVDAVAKSGTFDVYQLNNTWQENTLTYNTPPPALGTSVSGNHPVAITGASWNQFVLIDITPLAKGWLDGTIPNNGVALALVGDSKGSFSFDSKESLLTANGPELEIALSGGGAQGPQGPPGPQGPQGLTGPAGPTGPQGLQGQTGATGSQGPTGQQGPQGLQGPIGVDGAPGAQGSQGPAGQGFTIKGDFDKTAKYAAYDVVSFKGSSYVARQEISPGDPAPDSNPNWSLMAKQGSQGVDGAAGSQGATGAPGAQGPPGIDGAQGPKGDKGDKGDPGPLGMAGPDLRASRAALLQWYRKDYPFGSSFPGKIAFDGVDLWVIDSSVSALKKVRVSDGAIVAVLASGPTPSALAFDGSSMWVANASSNTVTKLRASDGACLNPCVFSVPDGSAPIDMAFDGTNMWVISSPNIATRLRVGDGACIGSCNFTLSISPTGIAFDGTNLWITSSTGNTVTKLNASDGTVIATYPVGQTPNKPIFDGANVWIPNSNSNNITKLRASDGFLLGTFPTAGFPADAAFDGSNVWVSNSGILVKLRASDGVMLEAYDSQGFHIAFDGANIWLTNNGIGMLSRF